MKRKNIAVCVTGYNAECESKIVVGVRNRCRELGYNTLVFAAPIRRSNIEASVTKTSTELLVRGENEIFNLVNYKEIDGVIILGETFSDYTTIYDIAGQCRKNNIPVVNVNDLNHQLQHNVVLKDYTAMEKLIDHLVKDHHLTKINFIAGVKENRFSDDRLQSYLRAMKRNGLAVSEDQIGYGNYWSGAVDVTRTFLEKEKPEAIVCANDVMAIFCMDYLKNLGYKIPEDIIVTGFDGIQEANKYSPTITTVQPDFYKAGAAAVDVVTAQNAAQTNGSVEIGSTLILQGSCGCKSAVKQKQEFHYLQDIYNSKETFTVFNHNILGVYTNSSMSENIEELCKSLLQGAWTFKFRRIYICLNKELERGDFSLFSDGSIKNYNGISEKLVSMCNYGHVVPFGTVFNSSDYLPENIFEEEEPVYLCFSPLHFKDKFLGYIAYEPTEDDGHGEQFSVWMMTAGNEIGTFYSIRELESMYSTDALTGLCNRRGMKKAFARMFPEDFGNRPESGYFTTVCADIDYLKPINDKFGHEAGDNAIVKVANAIKAGFPKTAVCVRTGGDEYCILLYSKTRPNINKYIEKVEAYLDKYNESSDLPYKVYCSLGDYTLPVGEVTSLLQMQKIADRKLYEVKEIRHGHKY